MTERSVTSETRRPTGVGARFALLRGLVLGLLGTVAALAQTGERVPNTSLRIDLREAPPPERLSETGLFTDIVTKALSPGIYRYEVNSELWSDGAYKTRYIALPGETRVEFSADGHWTFPENTVLVKNFLFESVRGDTSTRRFVETRFLINAGPVRGWQGVSYRWNDDGTEAHLLPTGQVVDVVIDDPQTADVVESQSYQFPAPEDCLRCHTWGSGQVLGVRTGQFSAAQLRQWEALGLFANAVGDTDGLPRWADPADPQAPVAARARAWLAANCSHCHHPGGLRRTDIDLRHDTPVDEMGVVDRLSDVDDFDGLDRRIVAPGAPERSLLLLRARADTEERRMPPLATRVVDADGTAILAEWIRDLSRPTVVTETGSTPRTITLGEAYPNPFNASLSLPLMLSTGASVQVAIHDILGRRVRRLVDGFLPAGVRRLRWDGRDDAGSAAASGVYLVRVHTPEGAQTRRVALVR
jgi:uncharacterized repeat protein (TIGR03806 family)